jgi:hypothetical protein
VTNTDHGIGVPADPKELREYLDSAASRHLGYPIMRHFRCDHLPVELQLILQPFEDLAHIVASLPPGAEVSACLRMLLEAKDCAVRAKLERDK